MINYFKEQWENRKKILYLSKIDLIRNYRGATLGWLWAIIKPVFTIFIYYFTFVIGLRTSKNMFGYHYFFWLLAGIIPWFFIKDILNQGCDSIRKYSYLVTKIKFPVSIIPTFCTISNFILHIILLILSFVIFIVGKAKISIYIIQLPLYVFLMLLFFNFLNLLLASLTAISKDFGNLVKSFVFAIFWLSGIIWDVSLIDVKWLKQLLILNPVTFIVNGYRNCFIKHIWFFEEPIPFTFFLFITILTIVLSSFIYNKVKKDIPDLL